MFKALSDIATIKAGYPFRGRIISDDHATTKVIQVRDVNVFGDINQSQLIKAQLTKKREPDWLIPGDILFIAKGPRNTAACINFTDNEPNTVCSPHFFLVQIKPQFNNVIDPNFIAWQLNQSHAQRYFKVNSEGTLQVSIRRTVLEKVCLSIPDIVKQHVIANLYLASLKEQALLSKLLKNSQQQLSVISYDLMKEQKTPI